MFHLYSYVLLFYGCVVSCNCCDCKPLNITESYCRSAFVAHVIIVNVTCANLTDPRQDLEYGVKYVKFYKKSLSFSTVKAKHTIHTGRQAAVCGVEFDIHSTNPKETDWIFFGSVCHKEAYITTCSATTRWNKYMKEELETTTIKCSPFPPYIVGTEDETLSTAETQQTSTMSTLRPTNRTTTVAHPLTTTVVHKTTSDHPLTHSTSKKFNVTSTPKSSHLTTSKLTSNIHNKSTTNIPKLTSTTSRNLTHKQTTLTTTVNPKFKKTTTSETFNESDDR